MINYIKGDLFDFIEPGIVIPHVCNRDNKWGRGFVVPLMAKYMSCRIAFNDWYEGKLENTVPLKLGNTQIIEVEPKVFVANMVAQLYYVNNDYRKKRPLYYDALMFCMYTIRNFCNDNGCRILAPKFGSDLAGGNWEFIECLIEDIWGDQDVTIVEYSK